VDLLFILKSTSRLAK